VDALEEDVAGGIKINGRLFFNRMCTLRWVRRLFSFHQGVQKNVRHQPLSRIEKVAVLCEHYPIVHQYALCCGKKGNEYDDQMGLTGRLFFEFLKC
jgi:hypothetical protein